MGAAGARAEPLGANTDSDSFGASLNPLQPSPTRENKNRNNKTNARFAHAAPDLPGGGLAIALFVASRAM